MVAIIPFLKIRKLSLRESEGIEEWKTVLYWGSGFQQYVVIYFQNLFIFPHAPMPQRCDRKTGDNEIGSLGDTGYIFS